MKDLLPAASVVMVSLPQKCVRFETDSVEIRGRSRNWCSSSDECRSYFEVHFIFGCMFMIFICTLLIVAAIVFLYELKNNISKAPSVPHISDDEHQFLDLPRTSLIQLFLFLLRRVLASSGSQRGQVKE